ncbi:hypothetical protein [Mesorhizobium sp. M0965]|uniref:hypothetical protein n=1 Tax=Mesorhizobium sp. M0965 TaxID=2957036 RepID=UPI003339E364
MEFSAELVQAVLLIGGMPALALLVFYGLLKGGWGSFKFDPISSTWAAVIALAFLSLVALALVLTYLFFSTPERPRAYIQNGNLTSFISLLGKDPNSPLVVKLEGTVEERSLLGELHFEDMRAASFSALIEKMCAAKAQCIRCEMGDQSPTVVTITKTGEIAPNCKVDGAPVYCCA